MSHSSYQADGTDFDDYEDDVLDDDPLKSEIPARPRRKFLTRWSAGALALLVGAIGFYVGVRVEKNHVGSGSASRATSAFSSRFASGSSTTGKSTSTSAGSMPSGAGGFGSTGSSSGDVSGTISSIDGNTLYVKESSGNIVKVKLLADTTITKTVSVGKGKVYPGDTVSVSGASGSGGVVSAASLSDSGASASSSSSSSSSSGSSTTAVSSLFGN